jgi:hypothetical protein
MRDAPSEPAGAGDMTTPAGPAGGRLRALWGRLRLPRVTRWRLVALGAVLLVVLGWGSVAVSSTTMYSATVLVAEPGSGIGIPPPTESLDFGDVPQGMPMHRNVILENNGKLDSYVLILSWGGIRDFLSIDDAFFNLAPGEQRTVDFSVRAPANAPPERKSGRVFIVRLPWWWPR